MTPRERLARKIAKRFIPDGRLSHDNPGISTYEIVLQFIPRPRRVKRVRAFGLYTGHFVSSVRMTRFNAEYDAKRTGVKIIPVTITYKAPKKGKP